MGNTWLKKKRKVTGLLLAGTVAVGLTACTGSESDSKPMKQEETVEVAEAAQKADLKSDAKQEIGQGNSNANIANGGTLMKQGDWIYYGFDDGLYKCKEDGTQKQKLFQESDDNKVGIYSINVIDEWVYFGGLGISRIKTDGTDYERIVKENLHGQTRFVGNEIFGYVFDDQWEIDAVSDYTAFTATVKPEVALKVTEDDLMNEMASQGFQFGGSNSNENGTTTLVYDSDIQEVTISKSELSDFKIDHQESHSKGSNQTYFCSGILTTPYVIFELNGEIEYTYSKSDGWNVESVTITPEVNSVKVEGEWTGTYHIAGDRGQVTLSITDVSDDGTISGIYSWTPNVVDTYRQPGSYHVSGTIDKDRLLLDLKAGEWVVEPEKALSVTKCDISAILYVDDSEMKGLGHERGSITVSQ